jgi:hypothetical protein
VALRSRRRRTRRATRRGAAGRSPIITPTAPHHTRLCPLSRTHAAPLIISPTSTHSLTRAPGTTRTAFWDVGSYVYGGVPDPTWNEIDMIFRTSLVAASLVNASAPANATFVSTTFDGSFFNPIEHKTVFSPSSFPRFTGYMAREYHNYSVMWTPHYMTWQMDDIIYLNQTRRNGFHRRWGFHGATLIPWRPMTIRLILHTADGTLAPQPDGAAPKTLSRIHARFSHSCSPPPLSPQRTCTSVAWRTSRWRLTRLA